jgi:hypothetical protein
MALFYWVGALGCAGTAKHLECRQLSTRLDFEDLSPDQRRFAESELESCLEEQRAAEMRDSLAVEGLERRLDPNAP